MFQSTDVCLAYRVVDGAMDACVTEWDCFLVIKYASCETVLPVSACMAGTRQSLCPPHTVNPPSPLLVLHSTGNFILMTSKLMRIVPVSPPPVPRAWLIHRKAVY